MKKIIQISTALSNNIYDLFALCADGQVYRYVGERSRNENGIVIVEKLAYWQKVVGYEQVIAKATATKKSGKKKGKK